LVRDDALEYVVIRGTDETAVDGLFRTYLQRVQPQKIPLSKIEKEMMFNELALSSILYL
jgi:hypothetical protein